MIKKPFVSILLCTYNAKHFIKKTIDSLQEQDFDNFELLVLDDCSKDNTFKVLKDISRRDKRLRIFQNETTKGPYMGLNFLIQKAKGEYIAINDHDDIWKKEKLTLQIAFLENNKQYVGCGSAIENWYEKYDKKIYRKRKERDTIAWHSTLVFRHRRNLRYDASISVASDFYFMKQILCKNEKRIYNFAKPLVIRRIFMDSSNLSGKWMKRISLSTLLKLDIPLVDKAAILNRLFIPQSFIEWLWVHLG